MVEAILQALALLIELLVLAVEFLCWGVGLAAEALRALRDHRARRPVARPRLWRRHLKNDSASAGQSDAG